MIEKTADERSLAVFCFTDTVFSVPKKVYNHTSYCTFLPVAGERCPKSATKGENPRFSPLETAFLFCACRPLSRSCRAQRRRGRHIALLSRRFVRHPQRGRSDTRRGQPVGWQPKAISRGGGAAASVRKGLVLTCERGVPSRSTCGVATPREPSQGRRT